MKSVYIAWANYQRRAVSMQKYMGFELFHIPPAGGGKLSKIAGYLKQSAETLRIVHRNQPDAVWVQLPPNFIVHLLLAYRYLSRRHFKIILDCHNAALRKPWLSIPLFASACRNSDLVVVHNDEVLLHFPFELRETCPAIVLEDPPSSFDGKTDRTDVENFVLVPCSFHDDEPIEMILAAARRVPSIDFKITGKLEKARSKGYLADVPANVTFTGFVSEDEFNHLLHSSAVVAGLTTYEGIQLSVASEAIGAGKALILSATQILRRMFGDCAVFFENSEDGFAQAVRLAIHDRVIMEDRSLASLGRRVNDWQTKAAQINRQLSASGKY